MAIINSYPIIPPTTDDLLLGTDVNASGQPTKNFTVQSIVDLVQGDATGLAAVLALSNDAGAQAAINFTNVQGSGTFTAGTFTDGTMSITSGTGVNFVSIASADFLGNLTGIVKAGSSIEGTVTGVTQPLGTDDTTLATTAFVQAKVDPSVLQYLGDATGPFDLNLVSDDFKISGTTNQIETTAVNVAAGIGEITLSFPTAGVTLPDGSTATTQALTDNSTDVATTAFVHGKNDAQDLNFSGTTGTGSVLINSQTLSIAGTTNEITTSASNQTLTIGLPTDVTIAGIFTGATFSGDLNGTINTATTGVTQSAGDDSTKIATTAYVDAAAGAKTLDYAGDTTGPFSLNLSTDDLEFNGDSNITVTAAAVAANKGIVTIDLNNDVTISGTLQAGTLSDGTFSGTAGTYTGGVSITSTNFVGALTGNADTATALAASGAIALTGDTTSTGGPYTYTSGGALSIATTIADTTVTAKVLTNLPTPTSSAIAATDTILAAMGKLQGQINGLAGSLSFEGTWDASTDTPTLSGTTPANGVFYIVSVAGNTNLDGITDWQVGDWAIYVDNGAGTDAWQKLDQSNEVLGSGAANKIAKWTSTNTLATGLIEDDGTDVTVGNSGNLIVEGNTTLGDADTDTTTVKGPGVFEETAQFNVGIGLSSTPDYGTAGQVLTSGGGSATANTWTTPTTGTVTSVAASIDGDSLSISGSPVTSSGTLTFAFQGTSSQYIDGAGDLTTFPTLDNYQYWKLSDGTNTTDITSTGTAIFTGGTYITTSESAGTLTIDHDATTRADTTSTDAPAFGGTFEAVTSVTTNTQGHVTAIDVSTVTLPSAPFDNYQYWTLAGDSGTDQQIDSTNTATIAGGTGIDTVGSATDTLTINFNGTFPAAHGTQYYLPIWETATTLGDSNIKQNSVGTEIEAEQSFKVTGKNLSVGGGTTHGLTVGNGGPTKAGFNFGTTRPTSNLDFVAKQGIHYSGRLSANTTKKVMATLADLTADADFFGITARVYITSGFNGNAGNTTVRTARIYDVACVAGETPVFNKVIDQTTVGSLTVDFDAYTDGNNPPKRGFTINFTTNIATNSWFYITVEMLSARNAGIVFAAN